MKGADTHLLWASICQSCLKRSAAAFSYSWTTSRMCWLPDPNEVI